MLDKIEFLLGEAFTGLRRNGWMTFAAVSTVAVSLFLLGGIAYAYQGIRNYAETLPGKFTMRIHLKDGATTAEIQGTAKAIREIEGVKAAFWIPRDKAWAVRQKEDPELTRGIENPYPDAFKVELSTLERGEEIAAEIAQLPAVRKGEEGVVYFREEQRMINQGLQLLRWLGATVGGLLFVTAGILIYNTIRLAVYSRRTEIQIMRLVGASRITVQVPFLLEGMVQGAIGGTLAALIILGCKTRLDAYFLELQGGMLGRPGPFPLGDAIAVLAAVGAAYGLVCSLFAVRRPMVER